MKRLVAIGLVLAAPLLLSGCRQGRDGRFDGPLSLALEGPAQPADSPPGRPSQPAPGAPPADQPIPLGEALTLPPPPPDERGAEAVPIRCTPFPPVIHSGERSTITVALGDCHDGNPAAFTVYYHFYRVSLLPPGPILPKPTCSQVLAAYPVNHKLSTAEGAAKSYTFDIVANDGLTRTYRVEIFAWGYCGGIPLAAPAGVVTVQP
jgi:hypothetical protein